MQGIEYTLAPNHFGSLAETFLRACQHDTFLYGPSFRAYLGSKLQAIYGNKISGRPPSGAIFRAPWIGALGGYAGVLWDDDVSWRA